jgi:hypothetical protein
VRISPARSDDEFRIRADGWENASPVLHSTWEPPPDAADEELLIASVFSGVSQKDGMREIEQVFPPGAAQTSTEAGNGLYALYRSVIDDFGGALSIRSGSHFMNLKAGGSDGVYSAKVVTYPDWPPFLGNMVTVRVPLDNDR